MRIVRVLASTAALCLVGGVAGGLALGYLLSRRGGWLMPAPWAVYFVLLLLAIGAASYLDERRRLRLSDEAWPLPPGFYVEEPEPAIEAPALPATPDSPAAFAGEWTAGFAAYDSALDARFQADEDVPFEEAYARRATDQEAGRAPSGEVDVSNQPVARHPAEPDGDGDERAKAVTAPGGGGVE